jgi:hypothetical protein
MVPHWDLFINHLATSPRVDEDSSIICLGFFLDAVRQYGEGFRI